LASRARFLFFDCERMGRTTTRQRQVTGSARSI
jgi:hypothetical protein